MGVCLFEFLYGFCPYEDKNIASLINQINTKSFILPKSPVISKRIEELLYSMLTVDPNKRID